MRTAIIFSLFFSFLYGQNGTFVLSEASNGSLTVFPIHPTYRGEDIVAMFTILNSSPYKINGQSQIALQTTNNGLITNIQAITPMTNHTILLIAFLLPSGALPQGQIGKNTKNVSQGFVAIPIEQIVQMIYSPTIMSVTSVFSSNPPQGVLPAFSIDPNKRTEDLIEVVSLMSSAPIALGNSPFSPVSLSTTINGPYYSGIANTSGSPVILNGVIPQVQSITSTGIPHSTLFIVFFKPLQSNPYLTSRGIASIVVAPDQINGIIFTQY